MTSSPEQKNAKPRYRVRIFLFFVCALIVVFALDAGSQTIRTFERVNIVERSRDRWQRPGDILAPLNLKEGSTVAEIGSGDGYFSLKLAPMVGKSGSVFAVDVLKEPLAFLWIRAAVKHFSQLHVILGDQEDPHLSRQGLDGVLIANSYHEFKNPKEVMGHVLQALRPGGRLVIVDRGPGPGREALGSAEAERLHERSPEAVENELVVAGFEVVNRQDGFIFMSPLEHAGDRPELRPWWMIVMRRPY